MTERAIHDETGKLIGVVTHPCRGAKFFAQSVHILSPVGRPFKTQWEAANFIHAVHDNARGVSCVA